MLYFKLYSNEINKESYLINALDISIATENEKLILNNLKNLLLRYPNSKILLSSYLQIIYNSLIYYTLIIV